MHSGPLQAHSILVLELKSNASMQYMNLYAIKRIDSWKHKRRWEQQSNTLMNNNPSFPLPRDFKALTDAFHDEATNLVICFDVSSDK